MTDIVERLRKASVYEEYKAILSNLGDEAADEIEKLRELPGQWSQAEIALRDAEIYRLRDEIERLRAKIDELRDDIGYLSDALGEPKP